MRLESLNNSVDLSPNLQNVINAKTNSRGYNRSQAPQNNNIGIIQNFNSYHIELKNVQKDGASAEEQAQSLERNILSQRNAANGGTQYLNSLESMLQNSNQSTILSQRQSTYRNQVGNNVSKQIKNRAGQQVVVKKTIANQRQTVVENHHGQKNSLLGISQAPQGIVNTAVMN